jgi:uncharacterized protein
MLVPLLRLAALFAVLSLPLGAVAAETELAPPLPTPDAPRKILLQLATDEPRQVNDLLFNVVNIQKFYGQDNVRVAVVSFGAGNRALYKDTSPVKARIESLLQYDVEFVACGNTIEATNRNPADVIDGVAVVTAGMPEIVERQLQGWIYVRP